MKTRIISAAVLAPVLIALFWSGEWGTLAAALIICGISVWEFGRIFDRQYRIPLILLVATVAVLILARHFLGIGGSHRTLTACIMAAMLWGIWAYEHEIPNTAVSFTVLTTGMVYIGWLGGYMISLRDMDNGFVRIMLTMCLIWSADIFAFFVGKRFGKHHMLKRVSPKKTWEGYFGAIICTVLLSIPTRQLIPAVRELLSLRQIILLALGISVCAPLGDFGESMIKRSFGVKDSSNLIPGHGGFFDRFDAAFFAFPLAYYFFEAVSLGLL